MPVRIISSHTILFHTTIRISNTKQTILISITKEAFELQSFKPSSCSFHRYIISIFLENIKVTNLRSITKEEVENYKKKINDKLASITSTKDFARSNLFPLGTNQ